jgi:hypothetical protein
VKSALICFGGLEEFPRVQLDEGVSNLSVNLSGYRLAYIFTLLCPLPSFQGELARQMYEEALAYLKT